MDPMIEVLRRLNNREAFSVAVAPEHLTEFLARLVDLRPNLPTIAVRQPRVATKDALIHFARVDESRPLAGR